MVDNILPTIVAAVRFFAAAVRINMVANFLPPVCDPANLMPSRMIARTGGFLTAALALFIVGLWVTFVSKIGILAYINIPGTLRAQFWCRSMTCWWPISIWCAGVG